MVQSWLVSLEEHCSDQSYRQLQFKSHQLWPRGICDSCNAAQLRAIEVVRKVSSANHRVPARNQYQILVAWKKYIGCPSVMKVVSLIIKNMIIELICVSYWKKISILYRRKSNQKFSNHTHTEIQKYEFILELNLLIIAKIIATKLLPTDWTFCHALFVRFEIKNASGKVTLVSVASWLCN